MGAPGLLPFGSETLTKATDPLPGRTPPAQHTHACVTLLMTANSESCPNPQVSRAWALEVCVTRGGGGRQGDR